MSIPHSYDVSVIGGGLAGLSAAVRAASGGAAVVCFESAPLYGGLVANVGRLDDYPGGGAMAGATLADQLLARARALDVVLVNAEVTLLEGVRDSLSITAGSEQYASRASIVASGARLRQLGVPGELELTGRGVSQCDWCDGGLYRGKRVAVVGGGDAAVQAALHLAEGCESVALIVRGPGLRARRDYVLRAADNPKIEFLWETAVERIVGKNGVEELILRSPANSTASTHPFSAVFVFAGLIPNLQFVPASLNRDAAGYALADLEYRSSIPGVFVVGAARSGNRGSLVSAMGEAMSAAATAVADLG